MLKRGAIKGIAAVMAFTMLATTLAGCGKKNGGDNNGEELSEYVYVPSYTSFPKEVTGMNNTVCVGDMIYFTADVPVHSDGSVVSQEEMDKMNQYYESKYSSMEKEAVVENVAVSSSGDVVADSSEDPDFDISYVTGLYSIKTDGTGYKQLSEYVPPTKPEGEEVYASLDRLTADGQGNIWVLESVTQTIYDLPADFDPQTQQKWDFYVKDDKNFSIRKLSQTGAEVAKLNLSEFLEIPENTEEAGFFYINSMQTDSKGNVFISDGNGVVYVVDQEGKFLFKLKIDGYMNGFTLLKDGNMAVLCNGKEGGNILKTIDFNAKAWGQDKKLPNNIWNTSSGGKAYDFCFTDSSSLYGYNIETEASEKILTWLNCNVDGENMIYSTILENGDVFAISNVWQNEGNAPTFEVVTLAKTKREDVKQKSVITMATMWLDYNIRAEILKFNKSNPDYQIEIQDYSEYNTEEDYSAGLTKLNTEIISGKVPDIIQITNLPYKQYAAKGLLEDLYPFIDNDPDLDRKDFVESIMKAQETEGKLYQMSPSFSVVSIIGSSSVVGKEMGWTMADMKEIIKQHPNADAPFGLYTTKADIFRGLCMLNMDNFMNWQTGECTFNSQDFKDLLEFANTFPEKIADDAYENYIGEDVLVPEGRQLFSFFSLYGMDSNFQYEKAIYGGEITFKGFPCEGKNGNVAQFETGLAMTSSCKNKEGAWQFMRTLLMEDYQKNQWSLPISQKVFDDKLAEAMKQEYTTDENGNKVPVSHGGMSVNNGEVIEFYALTQQEADQLVALVNSVQKTAVNDESLMGIINEEVQAYFAGQKSVEETANIIQSRMNIYINEQR